MEYYIVEQTSDNLDIVWMSQPNSKTYQKVASNIFPSGSNWGDFIGHRAFKFIRIEGNNYLLSYSLVTGKDRINSALRSWGILATPSEFLRRLKKANNISDIFTQEQKIFGDDPKFQLMLNGLRSSGNTNLSYGFSWLLIWLRLQLGFKTAFGYNPAYPQQIEKLILTSFQSTLWKNSFNRSALTSFSTLSLSSAEPVQILAIPEIGGSGDYSQKTNNQSSVIWVILFIVVAVLLILLFGQQGFR